jgi:hypothetical protein
MNQEQPCALHLLPSSVTTVVTNKNTQTPKGQSSSRISTGIVTTQHYHGCYQQRRGGPLNSTRDFPKPILDDATLLNVAHAAMICDATTSKMNKTKSTQQKNRI